MVKKQTYIPVSNIVPLVFREGASLLELIHGLAKYVQDTLEPSLKHVVDNVVAEVESQMDQAKADYVAGVQEFQRIHDAFMSDVNASLVALNDHAVSDLASDESSLLFKTLESMFATHERMEEYQENFTNFQQRVDQRIDQSVQDIENTVDTELTSIRGDVDSSLNDFQQRIDNMSNTFMKHAAKGMESALGGGYGLIVMVGSSTSTRNEYPREIARHVHTKYNGGMFRTLRPSRWGEDYGELRFDELSDGAHVINAAWGGSVSGDYLDASLANDISALNPSIIMHSIGSNDYLQQINPTTVANNIHTAVNRIKSSKQHWHVLVHQHERRSTWDGPHVWDDYLDALHDVAQRNKNVIVVNASKRLKELGVGEGGQDPHGLYADDMVHLNSRGHMVLGQIVAKELGWFIGGVQDSGWLKVTNNSEHVIMQISGESSTNEPLVYRTYSDGGGYTTLIRGINTRNASGAPANGRQTFAAIARDWRNTLIPKVTFDPHDRHRVGTWHTVSSRRGAVSGPIYIRSSGAIHAADIYNDMGGDGYYVDIMIRA